MGPMALIGCKKKCDVNKPADTHNFFAAIPQIWLSNTCNEVCNGGRILHSSTINIGELPWRLKNYKSVQVFILANFNITSAPWYAVVALALIREPDPRSFCSDVYLSGVKPETQ